MCNDNRRLNVMRKMDDHRIRPRLNPLVNSRFRENAESLSMNRPP
jgi:hypothetical protein